ncbi:MAG: sensor histidine kinase [Anaerolineales bacterium]|nr:sensor histidine kinase [Anaerolineales bacterium]
MKSSRLEPGILNLFRLFLIVQFALIFVNVMAHSARGYLKDCPWCAVAFGAANILILLGYLSWPWLQERMGRFYLPIALLYAVIFSLVAQNLFLTVQLSPTASGGSEESAWQIFLFLFVPLVLVSWQYDFKAVIAYCLFTTFLDFALIRCSNPDYFLLQQTFNRLLFIRFLSFLLVGYIISRIMQQLRQQRQALQEANLKLERYVATIEQLTVSRERNRLARELHDTLAHTLSGVAVQLEAVDSLWTSDREQAHHILRRSLGATREGLTETRVAIQSLRATPLEDLGLVNAMREYAEFTARRAGFQLRLDLPDTLEGLTPEVEQCFYRIGQEALENAARHANANLVQVTIKQIDLGLRMEISDDGTGFDTKAIDSESHFGLRGMYERAQVIHADLAISSHPGKGTRLTLSWKNENKGNGSAG